MGAGKRGGNLYIRAVQKRLDCLRFVPYINTHGQRGAVQQLESNMTIYIYSNETGKQVDAIEGADNAECEALAQDKWGSNDFHWSYKNVEVSDAI